MQKNWYLSWENVIYEPGELKAAGWKNGKKIIEKAVRTTGSPYGILMNPYRDRIETGDMAIVNIDIVDSGGMSVPTADNEIYFEIEGGTFIGTGNGNPGDHSSEKIPVRRAFNGRCQLLARADGAGEIKITASSNGLASAECKIEVQEGIRK